MCHKNLSLQREFFYGERRKTKSVIYFRVSYAKILFIETESSSKINILQFFWHRQELKEWHLPVCPFSDMFSRALSFSLTSL